MLLLCVLPMVTHGQQKQRYLFFGPGWSYNTTKDDALSPLRYRGNSASLALGYEAADTRKAQEVWAGAQYGHIRSAAYEALSAAMLLARTDIIYRQLHHAGAFSKERYHVYAGGGFLVKAVYREHNIFSNNAYQYDYATSLALEGRVQRTLSLKHRSLDLAWGLSVPVLSVLARPGYNSSIPEGFVSYPDRPVKAVLASIEPGTFGSYTRVLSTLDIGYRLLNGNALRLRYTWDIYHYAGANAVTSATHTVHFLLLFNLSKPS